ncbi:molybdopterin-guanine dinucleotide biosynthesis protein B [Pseudobythopirellula maris]|nr:molybdopterin-guanine dinucleotide biosynthesis protein B [Pseudobythopirellula maris]
MNRLHIVGGKNHGKTTLVCELVELFAARGLRVGTIKHTHHAHELDTPGKDSHRHRKAGAAVVGILSPGLSAVFWPPADDERTDRYAAFAPRMAGCDLVLVEGDSATTAPKVEVWREAAGGAPRFAADRSTLAIISDDPLGAPLAASPLPVMPRSADDLADRLLSLLAAARQDGTRG